MSISMQAAKRGVQRRLQYQIRNNANSSSNKIWTQVRYLSSSSDSALTVGILRETYDTWERRTPLCPNHVQNFKQNFPESQVLVQPSFHRIYTNQEYETAGATIQEDLSTADIILGVKRPKQMDYDNTMYAFFSHVIKGQPENMGLLQETLQKNIALMDYECILESSVSPQGTIQETKKKRSVAFGKYAGLAGMIDTFSILGRRLLLKNYSTPFLNCPPAIFHGTLDDAKRSVTRMGEQIAADGLPSTLEPLVFAVTGGPNGNVHEGVKEILTLLPHETIEVKDLPQLFSSSSSPNNMERKIYCVSPNMQDIYKRKDEVMQEFDRKDFQTNPHLYSSVFADDIARYSHVLMNCAYWDDRFPRLLTKDDILRLYDERNERLMVVSDISCDVKGSIEFLERSTTIDKPCFQYDPVRGKEVSDAIGGHGVTVMGVDILPTELPRESSTHFGNAVGGIIEECAAVKNLSHAVNIEELSPKLANAIITTRDGKLSSSFKYLDAIMKRTPKQVMDKDQKIMTIMLEGHLFDSGLINQVLDILDTNKCGFQFKECHVRHRGKDEQPVKSTAILEISMGDTDSAKLENKIDNLVSAVETADATFRRIDHDGKKDDGPRAYVETEKNILLLGSGLMAKSVTDYLGRSKDYIVTVASNDKSQARTAASFAKRGYAEEVDVENDRNRMSELINRSNVVISLLPAPMHPQVAELCIEGQTDLVTASYESKAMQDLGIRAKEAGITILNEVGLDPGLDHMSAMKIIDDIQDRGGMVTKFSSVCGGLPAPEAADNPLKYKFSWNPRGVISASQNDARYRWEGADVRVYGKELLQSAAPFIGAWNDLDLEILPNRDSLHYERTYGIEGAETLFRGTLRYQGFSSLLHTFQNMGFFDESIKVDNLTTWNEVLGVLRLRGGFHTTDDFLLACAQDDPINARRAKECLEFLGMMDNTDACALESHCMGQGSVVDLFCMQLQEKLKFDESERDMVIMHHSIGATFDDGRKESHSSSLQVFGDRSMSAMCKTVGQTAAASAELLISGNLQLQDLRGLVLPSRKEIYSPILEAVAREGIKFDEKVEVDENIHKVA